MARMTLHGSWVRLAALGVLLAGCAGQPRTALPDPAILAVHESDHGPPWGPEEAPWVAPPLAFHDPYPWYAGGPMVGLGIRRGGWWGGYPGGYRGGRWGGRWGGHWGGHRGGFVGRGGFHGGHGFGRGGRGRR